MALLAGHRRVQTDEGKAGYVMVEYHAFVPFLLIVAAGTLFALLALVNIVILMAGKTSITLLFFVHVAAMAVLAGDVLVRTLQWKFGVLVVGESSTTPFAAVMTVLAFAAVAPGVLVIVPVTLIAGGAQLDTVQFSGMANIAPNTGVGAGQLEFGIPVVIEDEFFPFLLVVALPALLAIASRVDVIDAVARHAFCRHILITLIGMAAVARSFLVLAT